MNPTPDTSVTAHPRRHQIEETLRLGLLVGLYEAIAIVRWDWLLDDITVFRIAIAVLLGAVIVALSGLAWGVLGRVTRVSLPLAATVATVAVIAARWAVGDRFFADRYLPLLLPLGALLWAVGKRPRLMGLLAVLLATLGLQGRVPNYAVPASQTLLFLLPGILVTLGLGAIGPLGRGQVRRGMIVASSGLGIATAIALLPRPDPPPSPRANLLLIVVDTLRRDHVQPFGDRVETPAVAELAAAGLRFDDAVTVIPKTSQSIAALFTGRYPANNGVRRLTDPLRESETTLAEILRHEGYATAAFVHNGWLTRGRGFEQGFNQFWSFHELERRWGPFRLTAWGTVLGWRQARRFDGNTDSRTPTEKAIEWMASARRPFFAYLHTFDPHWPYRPPGEGADSLVNTVPESGRRRGEMIFRNNFSDAENQRARELYGGEVVHTDLQVGRLLRFLDSAGLANDTLVVLTADHGHSLGEHDYYYHHGELLYDISVSIPLVLRFPGRVPAGEVIEEQARIIDVMPTILSLLMPRRALEAIDGVDALHHRPGPAFLEADPLSFPENRARTVDGQLGIPRAVRDGRWKLIVTPRRGGGIWELYDLAADPGERHDLIAAGGELPSLVPELLADLARGVPADERRALEAIGVRLDRIESSFVDEEAETAGEDQLESLSEADKRALRALGYIE